MCEWVSRSDENNYVAVSKIRFAVSIALENQLFTKVP